MRNGAVSGHPFEPAGEIRLSVQADVAAIITRSACEGSRSRGRCRRSASGDLPAGLSRQASLNVPLLPFSDCRLRTAERVNRKALNEIRKADDASAHNVANRSGGGADRAAPQRFEGLTPQFFSCRPAPDRLTAGKATAGKFKRLVS